MHRIYFCFIALFFLGATAINAQLKVEFAGGVASAGSTIDVDVVVRDFDQLPSVQFSINWDPNVFTYNSILNVTDQLPSFALASISTPPTAVVVNEGQLVVSWSDGSTNPFSLDDGTRLFTIRLNASGSACEGTSLIVSDVPREIEVADADFNLIGVTASGGDISVDGNDCNGGGGGGDDCTDTCAGSSDISLIASCESGESGENICVTVTGRNVTDIVSIITGIKWDPAILRYTGTTNKELPAALNENESGQGRLRVLWSLGSDGMALNLPDNSELFDLCFDIIGSKGQSSDIEFVDFPDAIPALSREITDTSDAVLQACYSKASLEVTDGEGGGGGPTGCRDLCEDSSDFSLIASCEVGKAGEATCVTFTGRNFTDIAAFQAGIRWNNNILNFKEIVDKGLSGVGVNATEAENGRTQLSWSAGLSLMKLTLSDNTELFDICFDAVGSPGQGSDVEIVDLPDLFLDIEVVDENGSALAFCVSKGEIEIEREQQANPLSLSLEDVSGMRDEEICSNVTVEGFEDIQSVQLDMQWDPTVLSYSRITDISLPEFGNSNANTVGNDKLRISWNPLSTATLADGTDLFAVCFTVIGAPGSSSDINFVDQIEISNSNNEVLDPVLSGGSISVTGGGGGGGNTSTALSAGNITGDKGEESCLSIRVSDLEDITSAQFTIEWDESVLSYTQVASIRFPDFNDSDAEFMPPNRLRIRWNSQTPFSLSDNSVLMQACFNVIGECDNDISSNIRFIDNGGNSLAFVNSSGTTFTPGVNAGSIRVGECPEVCNLSVSSVVLDNTCDQRGRIELVTSGSNGRERYRWDNGLSSGPTQTGLRGGTYCVTITDNADCEFTRCYTVRELYFDVEAFIDPATCDSGGRITLETDKIDEDLRLDYEWNSNLRDGEAQTNLSPGQYCVTVSERISNCVQEFCYTVQMQNDLSITPAITPVTNADGNNGAISLDVISQDDLQYSWSNSATTKDIDGLSADRYTVTITGAADCEIIQSYDVEWDAIFTDNITAERDGTVSCMGESDGIISGEILGGCGGNRVYLDGEEVELPIENLAAGSYTIRVDDNCDNSDERTLVITDPSMISATASNIECSSGTDGSITLDISGGSMPYGLDPSSGTVSGTTVTDLSAGTLTILITDDNGCEIIEEYTIDECSDIGGGLCSKARNLISPNGDGVNDEFVIGCLSANSSANQPNELGIYDRWGREVFGATNYDNTWQGTDESGAKLAEGGYMWILKVDEPGQPTQVFRGTLTLLRSDF